MKNVLKLGLTALVLSSSAWLAGCASDGSSESASIVTNAGPGGFYEGATMVAKVNLHPDTSRGKLYSLNYQQPGLIPMCAEVVIKDIDEKAIEFTYFGQTYTYLWEKHTRKAGESLAENFNEFFGESCDQAAVAKLSKIDQDGIKSGIPKVGMSKQGILFAMGRPPIHANPNLDSNTWMYWLNKFKRQAIEFNDQGIVTEVRL
ncbi:outer membrane protein assembly factor BamE domain-containing protein [Catenovulum agarivorans]|uniref:outer membrane protein assembly factor BamE domain-containing protein n=1 Tax=Catenovulum agarivorans TaxID=1172192 RepID=UPI0002DD4239|nr:outer membrane protein assembly factor BamE [Catenovulum agarivorans]